MHSAIGGGRFGPVFRAVDPITGVEVLVRTFAGPFTAEQREALVRALESLCETPLDHPSIARPMAFGVQDDRPYLVHACLPGLPADQYLRMHGPQPVADLVLPITHAAAALDYAAAAGIHHGVIALADLILGADGGGLSGFGVVQALAAAGIPCAVPAADDDIRALATVTLELMLGSACEPSEVRAALERCEGIDADAAARLFDSLLGDRSEPAPRTALEFASSLQEAIARPVAAVAPLAVESGFASRVQNLELSFPTAELRIASPESGIPNPDSRIPNPESGIPTPDSPVLDLPIRMLESSEAPEVPDLQPLDAGRTSVPLFAGTAASPPGIGRWWLVAAAAVIVAIVFGFAGGFSVGRHDAVVSSEVPAPPTAADAKANGQAFSESVVADPAARSAGESAQKGETAPGRPPQETAAPARRGNPPPAGQPAAIADAPRAIGEPQPTSGRILVHSSLPGARVRVDGRERGETPAAIRDLPFGVHTIEVDVPGRAPWRREIVLTSASPAQSLEVTLQGPEESSAPRPVASAGTAPGALHIESRPSGAQVYVDDALIGRTPLSLPGVEAGTHGIRIEAAGYRTWTTSVAVASGARARVAASLEQ